jgi:hypothetical protein
MEAAAVVAFFSKSACLVVRVATSASVWDFGLADEIHAAALIEPGGDAAVEGGVAAWRRGRRSGRRCWPGRRTSSWRPDER